MPQFNNETLFEVCITAGRPCSQYGIRAKVRKHVKQKVNGNIKSLCSSF